MGNWEADNEDYNNKMAINNNWANGVGNSDPGWKAHAQIQPGSTKYGSKSINSSKHTECSHLPVICVCHGFLPMDSHWTLVWASLP